MPRNLLPFLAFFAIALAACTGVRAEDAAPAQNPHGPLKIACEKCHAASAWRPILSKPEFDHSKTSFPLRGMHVGVRCEECHINRVFSNIGANCQDCHADLHRRKNGAQCDLCHRVTGWQVSIHDINEHQDRFPLIGAHAVADCYSCHKVGAVGQFNRQGLSTACNSCHLKAFQKATAPNHVAMGFSMDCQQCHNSFDTWVIAGTVNSNVKLRR